MYDIPKETKSETKMTKSLYLIDLAIVILSLGIAKVFENNVYMILRIPYYIFTFLVALFLVIRPHSNPDKRNYQALLLAINRNKQCYSSIDRH